MSSSLQVILREDMSNLGKSGDLVKVRSGYARNYLIPRALAVPATDRNVARVEHEKREAQVRAEKLKGDATTLASKLEAITVRIARKVGEENRLFGSVTTKDIDLALKEQGITIDRKKIELGEPIRTLGTVEVKVKLVSGVTAIVKVEVVGA